MLQAFKRAIKSSKVFKAYSEYLVRQDEIRRFIREADLYLDNHDLHHKAEIRKLYIADLKRYMFTFDEWFCQYRLCGESDEIKSTFISRSAAQKMYRAIIQPEWRRLFHDKKIFAQTFKPFIKRRILEVLGGGKSADIQDFISKSASHAIIVKPVAGSLGQGIFKVEASDLADESEKQRLLKKIYSTESIIEECIKGCEDLQKFHPQSLNTIRVVTVSNGSMHRVFGSFFRMGCGNAVIDNAHAGGIFAHIDIDNGIIDSDGVDTQGCTYEKHPDSNITIKGTGIPQWEEIKAACIEAHKLCKNFMVGWDVVVNSDNHIDFIEGNHAPDMDVMQSPLRKGIRRDFEKAYKSFIASR